MTARPGLRIDKFLWHTRLVKTRSLAARLCESGHVMIGGTTVRGSAMPARIGDTIILVHGGWRRTIQVVAMSDRRGPASEAATLYVETAAPLRLARTDPLWTPLIAEEASD